jgi:hypothetical protein
MTLDEGAVDDEAVLTDGADEATGTSASSGVSAAERTTEGSGVFARLDGKMRWVTGLGTVRKLSSKEGSKLGDGEGNSEEGKLPGRSDGDEVSEDGVGGGLRGTGVARELGGFAGACLLMNLPR